MAQEKKGTFADLLDVTFNLLSRTWMTSLILGGVLFIPTAFLFGSAYNAFMDAIKDMAAGPARPHSTSMLATLGLGYLWIILAAIGQGVVYLFVRACVTEHSARVVRGESAATFTVAAYVIKHKYGPLLGQRVLQMIILSITFGGAVFITSIVIGVAIALQLIVLAMLLGSVLGLAGITVSIWIAVRYMVTLESMVVDGAGIEQSFDRSMALVKDRWWRVFGYTLLFGLMVSFASSLIGTPIMFFSTIRQFMHALEGLLRNVSQSRNFNTALLQMMAGLGRRLGILQYVRSVIAGLVSPVFMTLLFLELKKQPEPHAAAAPPSEPPSAPGALPPEAGA